MTKDEFRDLFIRALEAAAEAAEPGLVKLVPGSFAIELHAPGSAGRRVSVDEAVDRLYLGPDRFYQIIDVALRELAARNAVAFVRVSGHAPGAFGETWDPTDMGPFKQLLAETIEHRDVRAG